MTDKFYKAFKQGLPKRDPEGNLIVIMPNAKVHTKPAEQLVQIGDGTTGNQQQAVADKGSDLTDSADNTVTNQFLTIND
jgi:hypothetical protein